MSLPRFPVMQGIECCIDGECWTDSEADAFRIGYRLDVVGAVSAIR
jgi:hypothetical protein